MNTRFRTLLLRFWDLVGGVSVRTKIFGIVLGSTLLLSLGFAIQIRFSLLNVLEQKSQEQGVSITRDVAARSTDLILINDMYSLHQLMLETQSNFPDVRYAFVVDPQGHVLAHSFGSGFPPDLVEINTAAPETYQNTVVIQTEEGVVWDVAVPIFDGQAGTARVGISDQSVRRTLTSLTSQMAATILGVVTLSLLSATFLTWILTRPILGLVEATRTVAQGDFSPRVRRWANDEIGDLAVAFNQMISELGRLDELRQERENLRRKLLEGVITAQEEERRRIARELHDSTSQSLTSLKMSLQILQANCNSPQVDSQVNDLRQVVDHTLDEVHDLAIQLRPAALDDLGLAVALERYTHEWRARHNIAVDMVIHLGKQRLPQEIETALYRIVQEALTNVARHAAAQTVSVLVERRRGDVVAVIEDDGRGFMLDKTIGKRHLGLLGIRERSELLGGTLSLESAPQEGTSVFVTIPVTHNEVRE